MVRVKYFIMVGNGMFKQDGEGVKGNMAKVERGRIGS